MSDAAIYTAPVKRKSSAFAVVIAIVVTVAAGIGFWARSDDFANALLTATGITIVFVSIALLVVLSLYLPTRIEIVGGSICLVAPRSTTTYRPNEMGIRAHGAGEYAFVRLKTGRVLAVFRDAEPGRAESAFGAAGAEVGA